MILADRSDQAGLVDEEILSELTESIVKILGSQCDSRMVHRFIDGEVALDSDIWRMAADLGWLGSLMPESHDGLGLGVQGLDALMRQFGRSLVPGPFAPTLVGVLWLARFGAPADVESYLPAVAGGDVTISIPVSLAPDATLTLRDDQLHGTLAVFGSDRAGLVIVPATRSDGERVWAVICGSSQGLQTKRLDLWDLGRQVCSFTCQGVTPAATIADPDGSAGRFLASHLAVALASDSLGGAAAIASQTVDYLNTRVQFDKPLGSFQALKHRIADFVGRIVNGEHLLAQAVEAIATHDADADMWAALAKAEACDAYAFVAGDSVQLHGGVGHTWEFDVHMHVKRARLNAILGGNDRENLDFAAAALAAAAQAGRITTDIAL
jgi:alkylation response protein AidB-like acyl-CoA dehydrogenase